MNRLARVIVFGVVAGAWLLAAEPAAHYALILNDEAAAVRFAATGAAQGAGPSYVEQIRAAQAAVEQQLRQRQFRVTGAVETVLNAVFVVAPPSREAELQGLTGVKRVVRLKRFRPNLNRAVQLVNAPAAWNVLGGADNAGAGVKIAIIDTGIDQNHPGFQHAPPLATPAGFPKCSGTDCAFTNSKVIVARSYISGGKADDTSPRDHIGHGTGVAMIAAGSTNAGPLATITGMAPQAWLGNYKVFGSPGVNDFAFGDAIIAALDDAVNDGMNIAVMSLGSAAFTGPLDTGAICGTAPNDPCDAEALAVDNAVKGGMLVVTSAGNDGDSGTQHTSVPTLNTIASPATAPSALAAGASTNSHIVVSTISVPNGPQNLQGIAAVFGDGPVPAQPLTAPMADVSNLDGTGQACSALPANSLSGKIALVVRSQPGGCFFVDKATNVQNAGGVGVIVIERPGSEDLSFFPGGLAGTTIPLVLIGSSEGDALKAYLASHSGAQVTLDPKLLLFDVPGANQMAYFSSRGPSITYLLKPEVVAPGTDIYTATETYDPNGALYNPSGYTAGSGTSFSAPMVAGGAALVKQKNPGLNGLELKSAVVGTATQDVTENGQTAGVTAMGAGKLDAGAAIQANVMAIPAVVSFGALGQTANVPTTQSVAIHYSGTSAATLNLTITGQNAPTLSRSTLTFTPGSADQTVTLTVSQSPPPGIYSGAVTIQGGAVPIRVPYLYVVGDGTPYEAIPLAGTGFDGTAGQMAPEPLVFKIIDQYGVSVPNLAVTFRATQGGGQIQNADARTDPHGVAGANAVLGPNPGNQAFTGSAGGLTVTFSGRARATPAINNDGVVNAASFQVGPGIVPGSYISIFGTELSDTEAGATAVPLPLAIGLTSVSFDAGGVSAPGPMLYASPLQLNLQVPWELAGQSTAQVTVNVSETSSQAVSVPIAEASPAIYVMPDGNAAAEDHPNYNVITSSNPARRGQIVHLFLNGLGAVNNPPASGTAAGTSPLSTTIATPTVTIGNVSATTSFSGLAPGFPCLYQIDLTVPQNAPTGTPNVVVSVGGVSSPGVPMPVQ